MRPHDMWRHMSQEISTLQHRLNQLSTAQVLRDSTEGSAGDDEDALPSVGGEGEQGSSRAALLRALSDLAAGAAGAAGAGDGEAEQGAASNSPIAAFELFLRDRGRFSSPPRPEPEVRACRCLPSAGPACILLLLPSSSSSSLKSNSSYSSSSSVFFLFF